MTASSLGTLMLVGGGLVALVWLLHKVGRALASFLEALATLAVVLVALWLLVKTLFLVIKAAVTHWRTTLGGIVLGGWLWWWGSLPVALTVAAVAVGLLVWRWRHPMSFEAWVGRRLRSWWLRWTLYARRLPGWLRACGLTVSDPHQPAVLVMSPLGRRKVQRQVKSRVDQVPRVVGVRSGASWDEVRVRLVAGQKPEDFDEKARELAVARAVARCQVRELSPNVVSIDFQRRNLLADTVWCRDLADLVDIAGSGVDLSKVWSGRTGYGLDWHQSVKGSHTLVAGSTGAGKGAGCTRPDLAFYGRLRTR
jgi:S-DNA-T family DNA segregation ATPase FtsK/SpoIIIE